MILLLLSLLIVELLLSKGLGLRLWREWLVGELIGLLPMKLRLLELRLLLAMKLVLRLRVGELERNLLRLLRVLLLANRGNIRL